MLCLLRKRQSYTFIFICQGKDTGPFKWIFVKSLLGWAVKAMSLPYEKAPVVSQGSTAAQGAHAAYSFWEQPHAKARAQIPPSRMKLT